MTPGNLQALLQFTGLKARLFPLNSRYQNIVTATLQVNGQTIPYIRRRFIPSPDQFAPIQQHTVKQGERLDNLSAQYLGDPELFWRLCDANGSMRPEELEEPGITLTIALPQGVPGAQNA